MIINIAGNFAYKISEQKKGSVFFSTGMYSWFSAQWNITDVTNLLQEEQ